jgi:hypothetical protein
MQVKLIKFDKWKESIDLFEKRAQAELSRTTDVVGINLFETHNGDLIFQFDLSEERTGKQELCILAWLDADECERQVNNTLEAAAGSGKVTKFLNIRSLGKSSKCLAVFIAEHGGLHEVITETNDTEAEGQADKQDQGSHAKPKRNRKRQA